MKRTRTKKCSLLSEWRRRRNKNCHGEIGGWREGELYSRIRMLCGPKSELILWSELVVLYCRLHPLGLYIFQPKATHTRRKEKKKHTQVERESEQCHSYRSSSIHDVHSLCLRWCVFFSLFLSSFEFNSIFYPSASIFFLCSLFSFFHVLVDGAALRLVSFTDCLVGSFACFILTSTMCFFFAVFVVHEFHFTLTHRTLRGVHLSEIFFFFFFSASTTFFFVLVIFSLVLLLHWITL